MVGATVPQEGRRLRILLPRSIILAPGLGAQGGDAASIHALRGTRQGDLLVPVSRGLTRVEDRGLFSVGLKRAYSKQAPILQGRARSPRYFQCCVIRQRDVVGA